MVTLCLPCRVSSGAATLPHRLPLRSIPPPRFACGASHSRDMGVHGLCGRVPDSAENVSPWIASAQTDANLSAHLHRLPTPPPYLRRMRLSPGRGAAFLQITYDARIIHQCRALGEQQKRTTNTCWSSSFVLACVLSVFTLQAAICSVLERR